MIYKSSETFVFRYFILMIDVDHFKKNVLNVSICVKLPMMLLFYF